MPIPSVYVRGTTPPELVAGIEALKAECGIVTTYAPEVVADADGAARRQQRGGKDFTALEFVTIDPPPSTDLDQALVIEREGAGYVVYYAIDDIAAWVDPGGAMDADSQRRGQTCYLPDDAIGLYPPSIGEGAASLLPEEPPRPAIVWTLHLDATGALTQTACERGLIRSRAKLNYAAVQAQIDAGTAAPTLLLLKEVGELRLQQEAARGGVSLPLPEQVVTTGPDGSWNLAYEAALPVENWNAQISLLTGMAAAQIMIDGKIGLLRTLPAADPQALRRLQHTARLLRIPWPEGQSYPDFVRSLDPAQPTHLAMLSRCTTLFRGAGYIAFHGELPPEEQLTHAALAAHYAHVTAPLRRLVDRYTLEVCVRLSAGEVVPDWVLATLDALPQLQADSDHREKKFERGVIDLVEALVLKDRIGETFAAVVADVDPQRHQARIVIREHAIEGTLKADVEFGAEIQVRLTNADPSTGKTTFELVEAPPASA